jgi:hypothetical protein
MSLSFNVKNAGPLSQVGFEIISLNTAVQLATGAYGWWKAIERSKSLRQLLSVSGGELVGTSSFNYSAYRDLRTQYGIMQGVVVQDREVRTTALPKASTAVPDHAGTACLRALIAGILCLYEPDATVGILQDLIPYALVQLDQEDAVLKIEGPLLTSLKQWVSAVATEEDCNNFRDHLIRETAKKEAGLTGAPLDEIANLDRTTTVEVTHVIGVLRWMLTPLHRREFKQYPTRSLRVWTTAAIMGQLGFDIYAAPAVVRNLASYKSATHQSYRFGEPPDVFLVVTTGGETDPMMLNEVPVLGDTALRPQVTMMRGIPWLAFRHLRGTSSKINIQYLVDVWTISFQKARARFKTLSVQNSNINIEVAGLESDEIFEHHKSIISEFSPHIYRICGPAMRHFVPLSSRTPGWDPKELMERLRNLRTQDELFEANDSTRDNCYVLVAILLGTIYGFCSKVCFEDGRTFDENSEIAFRPDIIYSGGAERLKRWALYIGHTLDPLGFFSDTWTELILELFLAHPKVGHRPSNYVNRQNPYPQRLLLGAQANGMTAVSEMVVTLTSRPEALGYFHIKKGQILNLPIDEDGYILASPHLETPLDLTLNPEPENNSLYRFDSQSSGEEMRVDIEPCWEADPRTVIFRVREMGNIVAPINIFSVVEKLAYDTLPCSCPKPVDVVTVPLSERWQLVNLYQLKRQTFKGMSTKRVDLNNANSKVLVDASHSETATIYALGIIHTRQLIVARDCLSCAYKAAIKNAPLFDQGVVILIPWKENP